MSRGDRVDRSGSATGGELVEIGGVARAHGLRGEIVVMTHDPASQTLADIDKIFVGGVEHAIVGVRDTQRGWLVQLEGTATRDAAEALRGKPVEVPRAALELDDDDVLLGDLIGCSVVRVDGTPWGTVDDVQTGAMQDLLVIHDGDIERMLPLVDQFVRAIDVDAKLVTVDPPDGLPEARVKR
jgi:16S rRNA processing protein RimM